MTWLDFNNEKFVMLLIVIVIALATIAAGLVLYFLTRHLRNEYEKQVEEENNSTKIYIINVKNNKITYFNRSDIKHKKTMDLLDFYSTFHPNDIEKVKNWVFSICVDFKNSEQYVEADVVSNRGKISSFCLLKLIKYDSENSLLYVEGHSLRYITPNNYLSKNKKEGFSGIVKRSTIANMINKSKSLRGYTFAIRFFYIRQKALSNENIEKYMVMTLKNQIYPFANDNRNPRQILEVNDNEIMLFDLRIDSDEDALHLANSIAKSLKMNISINGFSNSINFAIGIAKNGQYFQDFDMIFEKSEQACIAAQQNNTNVYLTHKSSSQIMELSRYVGQVNHLFERDALRYLFRPIVDAKHGKVMGYFEYVKCYDSPFSGFMEMSKYAQQVGKNKRLFSQICKTVIPKFANEIDSKNNALFMQVSMMDISFLYEVLEAIPRSKDIKLVLMFDEQEANENSSQLDLFNNEMERLKKAGYRIALLLKDRNLLLDPSIYLNFDYFVAGANTLGEIKKNSRVRLSISVLIEKLLKYGKPIVATDLEGWQAVELIVKSGVNLVSSEAISSSNDMLLPLDKKKKEKLAALAGQFNI